MHSMTQYAYVDLVGHNYIDLASPKSWVMAATQDVKCQTSDRHISQAEHSRFSMSFKIRSGERWDFPQSQQVE